jgi:fatty acid desaturase
MTVWSISARSWLPVLFFPLARLYGGWLHQLFSLTQHAGLAENVRDYRLNTRTVNLNHVFRFLYFNMNYHIEHHMFPMVPFHALPRLHERVHSDLPRTYTGLIDAFKEIVPVLIRQSRDANYFMLREVPGEGRVGYSPAEPQSDPETTEVITGGANYV